MTSVLISESVLKQILLRGYRIRLTPIMDEQSRLVRVGFEVQSMGGFERLEDVEEIVDMVTQEEGWVFSGIYNPEERLVVSLFFVRDLDI